MAGAYSNTHVVRGPDGRVSQLSPIGLPRSDIPLGSHLQIDGIHHDTVPRSGFGPTGVEIGRIVLRTSATSAQQLLVISRVMLFVEPGGQSKVG